MATHLVDGYTICGIRCLLWTVGRHSELPRSRVVRAAPEDKLPRMNLRTAKRILGRCAMAWCPTSG